MDILCGSISFYEHIFHLWMDYLSCIISLHGLTRRSIRKIVYYCWDTVWPVRILVLVACIVFFKGDIGKLYWRITENPVDLFDVFGLSREAKQNATSCVIFMLCCRNCAVHYKLDARFSCQCHNYWLNIFLKQWKCILFKTLWSNAQLRPQNTTTRTIIFVIKRISHLDGFAWFLATYMRWFFDLFTVACEFDWLLVRFLQ